MPNPEVELRRNLVLAVQEDKQQLARALSELRSVARERLDLSHRIAADPVPWMVGGFLIGFWLGTRRRH